MHTYPPIYLKIRFGLRSVVISVGPTAYIAERTGNLQQVLDAFAANRQYLDEYYPTVRAFSADDGQESLQWLTTTHWAGHETSHLYPFQQRLLRTCKLAELDELLAKDKTQLAQTILELDQKDEIKKGGDKKTSLSDTVGPSIYDQKKLL